MAINIVKGMHDIYEKKAEDFAAIEEVLKMVANVYGYTEYRTPILEHTELFQRSVGESSDVVRKEMYTFLDKGGRSVTMRPELTAGIMRLIVADKLYATKDLPIKAMYCGPSFRYERPGLGRYRQFLQFGVECVGVTSYLHDVETIILGYESLARLGLENILIQINTLGDQKSRENYQRALQEFFKDKIATMCPDCQERLLTNPLRILDCKVEADQKIIKTAPKMSDYLSQEAADYFAQVIAKLQEFEIPFVIDDNLVRGLDYYAHTVFEYHYTSKQGKNYGAIGAGGHYDNLVHDIGGPNLSGVGFALGLERIHAVLADDNLLNFPQESVEVYVMPLDESTIETCFGISLYLRSSGYRSEVSLEKRSLKQLFKRAERLNTTLAVLIGEQEANNKTAIIRDFQNKTQVTVPITDLIMEIENFFEKKMKETESHCHCHDHGDDESNCQCQNEDDDEKHCCCGKHHEE